MHFSFDVNAPDYNQTNKPSRRKPIFPVNDSLRHYLQIHGREVKLPVSYGDLFISSYLHEPITNRIRFAKEFVKFNERCFVRLLGDMRSYNFVVDITPDIEDFQYRIRAIDFDQQSYEGRKNIYLPQFFKENKSLVDICVRYLNQDSITQYQTEERTMMAFRVASSRFRLMHLLNIMSAD